MSKFILVVSILLLSQFPTLGRVLVIDGIDTLSTAPGNGDFDLLNERPSISLEEAEQGANGFVSHFKFAWDGEYTLSVTGKGGLIKDCGKISLDSITTVHDSEMVVDNVIDKPGKKYRVFKKNYNSIDSIVGNCYILKSQQDNRFNRPYYSKIKILGVDIIDSANHIANLRVLWAYEYGCCYTYLITEGIDSFQVADAVSLADVSNNIDKKKLSNSPIIKSNSKMLSIPKGIQGKGGIASIYSYNGKLINEVSFKPDQVLLDLSNRKQDLIPMIVKFR